MSKQREKELWKELERLAFWVAMLLTVLSVVAYFVIAGSVPENPEPSDVRVFVLNVITNLVPTLLLFVVGYIFLRRIQSMKAEKEAEEFADMIASKVYEQVLEMLSASAPQGVAKLDSKTPSPQDKLDMAVTGEFEVTNKYFDDKSNPQRIVVELTNRGNNILHVQKVKFTASLNFPDSALLASYGKEEGGRYLIIPPNLNNADVLPRQKYSVELCFAQKWERSRINGMLGSLGVLKLEVIYNGQLAVPWYYI
jgi:hypothetical protein